MLSWMKLLCTFDAVTLFTKPMQVTHSESLVLTRSTYLRTQNPLQAGILTQPFNRKGAYRRRDTRYPRDQDQALIGALVKHLQKSFPPCMRPSSMSSQWSKRDSSFVLCLHGHGQSNFCKRPFVVFISSYGNFWDRLSSRAEQGIP